MFKDRAGELQFMQGWKDSTQRMHLLSDTARNLQLLYPRLTEQSADVNVSDPLDRIGSIEGVHMD